MQPRFLEVISRKVIRADKKLLAKAFPKAFANENNHGVKKPLKIGIHNDIIQVGVTDPDTGHTLPAIRIKAALWSYCHSPQYHASISIGCTRVDLDGNEAGEVTEVQRKFSQEWLKRYNAKMKAKQELKEAA